MDRNANQNANQNTIDANEDAANNSVKNNNNTEDANEEEANTGFGNFGNAGTRIRLISEFSRNQIMALECPRQFECDGDNRSTSGR